MAIDKIDTTPIQTRDELVAWLEAGIKPKSAFRVGTEYEKFAFTIEDHQPVPYQGERSIRALLEAMQNRLGWKPIVEGPNIIGLSDVTESRAISLEPGGQIELSGAPLEDAHQSWRELAAHMEQLHEVARPLGIGFLGIGMTATWTRADMPRMPKGRYRMMTRYMPRVGTLGLDMMYRTCSVQANLDFCSEADMVKKFRVSLSLQPIATALFANSPFTEGRPNGLLSFRSEIWRDTDSDRCGMLPWVFEDGMGFERWVDYALEVPMYFLKRGDHYLDVGGQRFRDLLVGKLASHPGECATISDWANHLTTLYPEVRLKRCLEMRGADAGPWRRLPALPAFWLGILYDDGCLNAAWDMLKDWTAADRQKLRDEVPRLGFKATVRNRSVRDIARECLALPHSGLSRRARIDTDGNDETKYLRPLDELVARAKTPAEDLLERFHGPWHGSLDPVYSNKV